MAKAVEARGAEARAARKKERGKEGREKISFEERFDAIAYAAFGDLGEKLARAFELERVLAEAGMNVHPVVYGARVIFVTYLAIVAVLLSLIPIIYLPIPPMFKLILGLVLGMIPVYAFLMGIMYPQSRASDRSRRVEYELPFAATYMTTLARGGVSIGRIIEKLAESKVFHAMREEARRIIREVRFFGKDILSAIEYVASRHPNRLFKDFMLGWVSVIRTGGDIVHYLEAKTTAMFEARINAIRVIAERVAAFAEAYIIFAVIGSLGFYVFFAAGSLLGVGTAGTAQAYTSFFLFSFVVMPLVSVAIIVAIGKVLPPTGIKLEKTRKVILASIPLAAVIFLLLTAVTGVLNAMLTGEFNRRVFNLAIVSTLAALEAIAIPSAAAFISETRGTSGMEHSLASFLRDLAEVRKTGLSPERSLVYVARRDYGKFTWVVRQIAARVAWGFPLRKSTEAVLRKVKDWFVVMILTFLVDAIDVGGGSPITLDTLARFTSVLAELEVDLKRRIRSYVFMPYFGALLTAGATVMVLMFTAQTLSAAPVQAGGAFGPKITTSEFWKAATIFSISVMINSFLMGMVAGKMSARFTEAGFLHAALLTALVAAVVIALMGSAKVAIGTAVKAATPP